MQQAHLHAVGTDAMARPGSRSRRVEAVNLVSMRSTPLAALAVLLVSPVLQGRREKALDDFKEERTRVLSLSGQRHLEYGLELRKKGLTTQAAAEIVIAVEASQGRNRTAQLILGLMRTYEDEFWKRKIEKPSSDKLEAYQRKAEKLRQEDREARLDLVSWAQRADLEEQALEELRALLLEVDEPLAFDERGRLVVLGRAMDANLSERVRSGAIEINGRPYVRDAFLRRVPEVARIFEQTSPELRVRSTRSLADAQGLHAAAARLLPILREDFGAAPARRLQLVVLGEREHFDLYLDLSGLSAHKAADGFADRANGTALLCPEGSTEEYVLGLALHELTHLFQYGVSPAILPSWYLEGCAEAYGGAGTFRWDGNELAVRGTMSGQRLDELRGGVLPIGQLFEGDALTLLARDKLAARRFYAQAWAFVRFLEQGAGPEIAARFERWRTLCFGSAAGAELDKPYLTDASTSARLFRELFEKDFALLEREFGAWLEKL